MQGQILLLYAGQWEMVDEKTGEVNNATGISYILNSDLGVINNPDGTKGMRPAKSNSDYLLMSKIKRAPALYMATFSMTVDSKGKPVLKILDLEYESDVQLMPVAASEE